MQNLASSPLLDAEALISGFGLLGIMATVFAESGLIVCFFLPGDSLLFTAGLLVANDQFLHQPLWLVMLAIAAAAVLGDQFGYAFGRKVGGALFRRPNSRFFKQENAERAQQFMLKHGPKALVMARFIPVFRTFIPITAGIGRMTYRTFFLFNVIGAVLWSVSLTLVGYYLGQVAFVRDNIEGIVIGIVLISGIPIIIEGIKMRRRARSAPAAGQETPITPSTTPETELPRP
ncbi:DedA family protein [Streptomyces coelicoflavus]|uniref:Integral membrane protein n=1 Tax=Streptomyces coelicolor (strain ATCC BAA-471 / A3(2) / M145) TaxID=100226 RepID=Q9L1W0_STRCO|nr:MULTISPECIES: VTT domain-containing protein [Streptomyces]MYU46330.1 DedA family protein [Streptomyces sp. SID7813]QFI46606.1 DedA family protein [Streptomyces coelicolor A3(2)]TYP13961.1 membrane-associated protein [Streptomyces coelicolor]TYP17428.1 membrane-associated protein [Streptomyces coelicolor A3(2)]TYP22262.1 membrane-associated protein [Streptomyces coelicolor]